MLYKYRCHKFIFIKAQFSYISDEKKCYFFMAEGKIMALRFAIFYIVLTIDSNNNIALGYIKWDYAAAKQETVKEAARIFGFWLRYWLLLLLLLVLFTSKFAVEARESDSEGLQGAHRIPRQMRLKWLWDLAWIRMPNMPKVY